MGWPTRFSSICSTGRRRSAADPSQPFLASNLATAANYPCADLDAYFSATGAPAGSTHYQSAFFRALILNYLNFALNGKDLDVRPEVGGLRQLGASIQTPPEPRFGNVRKGYSNGDGNTEADVRTGMLGQRFIRSTQLSPAI